MGPSLEVPDTAPLFPLPNVVLFPGQAIPLHIFEERYQAMMRHVLSTDDRWLGMALLKKGWETDRSFPPAYDTACLGRVGEVQELPGGRCNIILHGLARVQVEDYTQRTPFRIARIAALSSTAPANADFEELLSSLAVAIQRVLPLVSRNLTWEEVQNMLSQLSGPDAVADFVAAYLPVDVHVRQELLETLDVELRLQGVLDVLTGLLGVLN